MKTGRNVYIASPATNQEKVVDIKFHFPKSIASLVSLLVYLCYGLLSNCIARGKASTRVHKIGRLE